MAGTIVAIYSALLHVIRKCIKTAWESNNTQVNLQQTEHDARQMELWAA